MLLTRHYLNKQTNLPIAFFPLLTISINIKGNIIPKHKYSNVSGRFLSAGAMRLDSGNLISNALNINVQSLKPTKCKAII